MGLSHSWILLILEEDLRDLRFFVPAPNVEIVLGQEEM